MNDRLIRREQSMAGIAVTEHGPFDPTVPKVVLVHGALDRAKSFLPVVEHLPESQGHRV